MSVWHAQSLFDYDNSSFSVLRALLVGEIQLSQTPKGKSGGWGKSGDREAQEVDPSTAAEPSVCQLPIQECPHLVLDKWWHFAVWNNEVSVVFKCLAH